MELPEKMIRMLQPSGLNSKFKFSGLSFQKYIDAMKKILQKVNDQYQLKQTPDTIEMNSPFEWHPKQKTTKGALLIHGLFDSPFIMRDIGQYLLERGFLVRSILLPGHGTIPADLLTTSTKEWIKATEYGIQSFQDEVDEFYLVGFSTGATLSLNYCLKHLQKNNPTISGLIMLSPAFALNTKNAILLRLYRSIRWIFKQQKWIFRHECPDKAKYTSFPVNSAYLVQRLITENKYLLKNKQFNIPLFIVISNDDETVRADKAINFFTKTTNTKNKLILYSNDSHDFNDSRITYIKSAKIDEYILDFSHIAIPVSPENQHYGHHGQHQEPLHEPQKKVKDQQIYYGATSPENEQNYRLQRLTYNPYFAELTQQLESYIEKNNPI